jgi:hypothetical protein
MFIIFLEFMPHCCLSLYLRHKDLTFPWSTWFLSTSESLLWTIHHFKYMQTLLVVHIRLILKEQIHKYTQLPLKSYHKRT